jgi:hypothetical protein
MAQFQDLNGTEWALRITVGSVADVKRETGINLAIASKDTSWVEGIFGADGKIAQVLWVLCEKQAKERTLGPEDFAHLLDGETLDRAGGALAESIADFFPRSKVAQALKRKFGQMLEESDRKAVAAIEGLSTDSPKPTAAPGSAPSIPES